MISVQQSGDIYNIRSPYDPNFIALVKSVPGRSWNPDTKVWTIHKDKLGFFINIVRGTKYESQIEIKSIEKLNENANIETTDEIPDIDLSGVSLYVQKGSKLFEHQLDFMRFAIARQNKGNMSGFLTADEAGLGKTLEGTNLALYNKEHNGFKHCLIICCVNSAKYNWQSDIKKHTNGEYEGYILGSRKRKNGDSFDPGKNEYRLADLKTKTSYRGKSELPYFIITNIESIRYRKGKYYPIASQIIEMINKGEINMIILDEVHKNTSPSSLQGKQLLSIKNKTGNKAMWIPMTGTPITKKPTDVFLPLKLIDGHNFTNYFSWCQQFCVYGGYGGYEIVSYKNIPFLKTILQGNMIRRLKSEVLDLPPKMYHEEYVELTDKQRKIYDNVLRDVIDQREEIVESLNPLVKLLRLRQVCGSPEIIESSVMGSNYFAYNAKIVRLLELVDEIVANNEKVVIFSNWVEPLRTLYKYVSKNYKVCYYTGTMKDSDREDNKRRFQNDPEYKVMIGTVGALGTSHTLTAARNVIFYDEPSVPTDKEQAEDRVHRVGTTGTVNIYTILAKDTIDERIHQLCYDRATMAKYIVDNKLDIKNNPEIFDMLIS